MIVSRPYRIFRYTLIVVLGLLIASPLVYLVLRSFMTSQEIQAVPPRLVPESLAWENYQQASEFLTPQVILNSFIVAFGVVLVQLVLALPAAFALAQIPFRWSKAVMAALVVPMFVPASFTLIPTFVVTFGLGLLNTYAGMILPIGATVSAGVLLFRQFFVTLPPGLVEAARLDGASWFRVFWRIMLPLAVPIIVTFSVVTFLGAWNMFIWPQVIATDPDLAVINVALAPVAGGSSFAYTNPAVSLAGATIGMLPALLLFVIAQKWLVRGVSAGTGLD